MAVLDQRVTALKALAETQRAELNATLARLQENENILARLKDIPKRASRAKGRSTAPAPTAVNSDTKATAA